MFRGLAATAGLHGSVLPGRSGETVAIQAMSGTAWKTVAHATLGSTGAYSVRLGAPGRYRVVYRSFDGPTVTVG
jgi:hypothetical protein